MPPDAERSAMSARHSGRSPWSRITAEGARAALRATLLPAWFVLVNVVYPPFHLETLGIDARLYQQATAVWLGGGDPWAVSNGGTPYAATPWSLLPYLPTVWLPLDVGSWLWTIAGLMAAVWAIRRLGMAFWWLAFPPLVQGLWNGNSQPIVLAALLVDGSWGVTLAGMLKIYGLIPALDRPRRLVIAVAALVATAPFLPWGLYAEHRIAFDVIADQTWNGSAFSFPLLIPPVAVALWILRRRGALWFTIPALWPGIQTFYHVFAMPAIRDHHVIAALVALPVPLLTPLTVILYAVRVRLTSAPRHPVASATIEPGPVLSSRK
jgi:hypothetical protein